MKILMGKSREASLRGWCLSKDLREVREKAMGMSEGELSRGKKKPLQTSKGKFCGVCLRNSKDTRS